MGIGIFESLGIVYALWCIAMTAIAVGGLAWQFYKAATRDRDE